jgi:hypothetical protein
VIADVVALAVAHPTESAIFAGAVAGELWLGGAWLRLSPLEQLAAGAAGLACWYASGRLALAAGGDVPLVVAGMFLLSGGVLVWALRR